jgi:hypothetical protein
MTSVLSNAWRRLWYTRLRDALRGRFNASLDWRLVAAEANLPADIQRVIDQVVRGTRLWRGEKVDVATELVAHFQDGLDAGHSPTELVQSFGDPQQTAQLIRRAKRRNRSLLWQFWRYGCWAVCGLILAYVAVGLWMSTDRPTIATDYLAILNERAASVPAGERAWPIYRDALLEMGVKPVELDTTKPIGSGTVSKPGDSDWPETQKFLIQQADALASIRQAASRPVLGFVTSTSHAAFTDKDRELFGVALKPADFEAYKQQTIQDRWVMSTLLPYLNVFKSAASLLGSDARRAAATGDGDTALSDVVAIYGISHHCEEIPTLVSELVAEAVQQQAREVIRGVLRDHPALWTDAQLKDLAHRVAAARVDWRRGFVGEQASFYDSMQRLYTNDGNGDGRLALHVSKDQNLFDLLNSVTHMLGSPSTATPLSNSGIAMLAMPATNMLVASRKEMIGMYDHLTNRAQQRLETPLWETTDTTSTDEELLATQAGPLGKFRYLFVQLLLPAYDAVRNRYATSHGEREGVLLGLALELYHREHGKWPASLAELSPRWLPELPVDRITGKPLEYKIINDRPIVYSVGVDGDDDGGREPNVELESGAYTAASPANSQPGPADNAAHDGDWVIWSTVKGQ